MPQSYFPRKAKETLYANRNCELKNKWSFGIFLLFLEEYVFSLNSCEFLFRNDLNYFDVFLFFFGCVDSVPSLACLLCNSVESRMIRDLEQSDVEDFSPF